MAVFDEDIFNKIVKIKLTPAGILAITFDAVLRANTFPSFKLITPKKVFDFFSTFGNGSDPVTSNMLANELAWTTRPVYINDKSFTSIVTGHPAIDEVPEAPHFGGYAGYLAVLSSMRPQYQDARTYQESTSTTLLDRRQTVFINLGKFSKAGNGNKVPQATFKLLVPTNSAGPSTKGLTTWRMNTKFNYDYSTPPAPSEFDFTLTIPDGESPFIIPKLKGVYQFFTFSLVSQNIVHTSPGVPQPPGIGWNFDTSTHKKQRNFPLSAQNEPLFNDAIDSKHLDEDDSGGVSQTITIDVTFPALKITASFS